LLFLSYAGAARYQSSQSCSNNNCNGLCVPAACDCTGMARPQLVKLCPDGSTVSFDVCSRDTAGDCTWSLGVCSSGANCQSDSDCGSGQFCGGMGTCQAFRLEGEKCGGFTQFPPQCAPGLRCQLEIIADVGGTCVNNGTMCRPFAQLGQTCNGGLPPQFSTLCQPPLTCVTSLPGANGVCESETGSEGTGSQGTGSQGNGSGEGSEGTTNYGKTGKGSSSNNGGYGKGKSSGPSGPRAEYEACSASYWNHNLNGWYGFYPDNEFSYAFDVKFKGRSPTLAQALQGPDDFLRECVAALLNAASRNTGYSYSVREVMSMVQDAWRFKLKQSKLTRHLQSFYNDHSCPFSSTSSKSRSNKQSKQIPNGW